VGVVIGTHRAGAGGSSVVLCVDIGSTFTKAALVDAGDGTLLATGAHPTTLGGDVLDGVHAAREQAERAAGVAASDVLACSSAGGGLRLAVVGYERAVTAEAGHRVALTAGGHVVHVHAGPLDDDGADALRAARPDVVLLTGGTDGGNADVLVHNARAIGVARVTAPVVLAGNAAAAAAAEDELARSHRHVVVAGNVLPEIGTLDPAPARAAIREVFLRHVIGGRGLSRDAGFAALVRAATPDAVLSGVELLAEDGDVMVIDVGGATTDVYSAVPAEALAPAGSLQETVAPLPHARTVEGDLGLRSGARGVLVAAAAEGLLGPDDAEQAALAAHVERAATDPGWLPPDPGPDIRLAALAARVAARRHGRPHVPGGAPRPLRDVGLLIGSGGVLRHNPGAEDDVLGPLRADHAGGWAVPERARVAVDRRYVLFAAGLLAREAPAAAARLARGVAHGTMGA
jgi:uncharacterized protein (TIGR01319 family)